MNKLILIGIIGILLFVNGCFLLMPPLTYEEVKQSCIKDNPEQPEFCECLAIKTNSHMSIGDSYMAECDRYLRR